MTEQERYDKWMAKVDLQIDAQLGNEGMTSSDLPDFEYRECFAQGDSPLIAARRAIRWAKTF